MRQSNTFLTWLAGFLVLSIHITEAFITNQARTGQVQLAVFECGLVLSA